MSKDRRFVSPKSKGVFFLPDSDTLFDAIGGAPAIREIVEHFYPKVQAHPLLAPLFPADVRPVMEKQYQFLTQFFGGPSLYSDEHGHPMMRARHLPFPITRERAGAWLDCMSRALAETNIEASLQQLMIERLSGPAYHFINTEQGE
jgi:hemoglobin